MKIRLQSQFSIANIIVGISALVISVQMFAEPGEDSAAKRINDRWAPFRPFLGHWKGTGRGPAGQSVQETEWKVVLNGTFLQCKSSSKAKGDDHQDIGLISYDESRKKYIYRAFHSEGFVNRYVADISSSGSRIVFSSEAIENGPKGLKAMEIIELKNGKLFTTLKLASGADSYKVCASGELERVKSDKGTSHENE